MAVQDFIIGQVFDKCNAMDVMSMNTNVFRAL